MAVRFLIRGGNSPSDKAGRKMRVGTEQGAVKGKRPVRTCKAETDEFNPDGYLLSISKEIESTHVEHMSPDTVVRIFTVKPVLKGYGLAFVFRRNIFLKR